MATIFITGATGNLGSRTAVEILTKTDAKCVLLVYAKSDAEASSAVEQALLFWDIKLADYHSRVEVISGDMTIPTLGLDPHTFERLAKEITHTIHCAANFKLNLSLSEARKSIVESTQNIVSFTNKSFNLGTFKHFQYISSLDALGTLSGPIPEDFITSKRQYLNTYQQAKAEAEAYLHKLFIDSQYPVTIYRPSMLVGETTTGKIINPQSLYNIIDDMFLNPVSNILPGKKFIVNPMPVDFIAQGLTLMHDDTETVGKVYHFLSPRTACPTLPQFITQVQKIYAEKYQIVKSVPHFIDARFPYVLVSVLALLTFGNLKNTLREKKMMIKYLLLNAHPHNQQTLDYMQAHGISLPHLEDYLSKLCEYMIVSGKKSTSLQQKN